ncbi:hypothetical protein BJ322DRAFT_675497 [Thelephora terrestris]|uniref:Fido domain-containing protein n=1 Tax=Thelephora terrestris TaxID=56493 RepID=A0A9P6L7J9_9AGAM|nr:hypothetical protein BJ322DRAFT_675497 [Thelephora terrestris]
MRGCVYQLTERRSRQWNSVTPLRSNVWVQPTASHVSSSSPPCSAVYTRVRQEDQRTDSVSYRISGSDSESALVCPLHVAVYEPDRPAEYPPATLSYRIIKGHPFQDGNKPTGRLTLP